MSQESDEASPVRTAFMERTFRWVVVSHYMDYVMKSMGFGSQEPMGYWV